MEQPYLIAVHAGAGFHAEAYESGYQEGLIAACKAASKALCAGKSSLDAATAAIKILEDCHICNAGQGSNLTFGGSVECDASLMCDSGAMGLVGAVPGVHNPVLIAHRLAVESSAPLSHGRVRPIMLAGDQARSWALSRGIPAASSALEASQWNLTEASKRRWRKYRQMVDGLGGGSSSTAPAPAAVASVSEAAAAVQRERTDRPRNQWLGEHCLGGEGASSGSGPHSSRRDRGARTHWNGAAEGGEGAGDKGHPMHAKRARRGPRDEGLGAAAWQQQDGAVSGTGPGAEQIQQAQRAQHRGGRHDGGELHGDAVSPSPVLGATVCPQQAVRGGQRGAVLRAQRRHSVPGAAATLGDGLGDGEDGCAPRGGNSVLHDTVGCVVVDGRGRVAAGVSSGGIALKTEGRVGEAAVPGAGCWAERRDAGDGSLAVACSVSGVGEHIMRHMVARECAAQAQTVRPSPAQQQPHGASLQQQHVQQQPQRDCEQLLVDVGAGGQRRVGAGRGAACGLVPPGSTSSEGGDPTEAEHRDTAESGGIEECSDEGEAWSAPGVGPSAVSSACAAVLQRTVMQGPTPRDCGVLCVRAVTSDGSNPHPLAPPFCTRTTGATQGGTKVPSPVCQTGADRGGLDRERGAVGLDANLGGDSDGMVEAELGVACTSRSMAIAYVTHAMSKPQVSFMRGGGDGAESSTRGRTRGACCQAPGRHMAGVKAGPVGQIKTLLLGLSWPVQNGR